MWYGWELVYGQLCKICWYIEVVQWWSNWDDYTHDMNENIIMMGWIDGVYDLWVKLNVLVSTQAMVRVVWWYWFGEIDWSVLVGVIDYEWMSRWTSWCMFDWWFDGMRL